MVAQAPPETDVLQFHCDFCLAELCVPAAFAGVTGPCPHCGSNITAPSADFLIAPIPQRPLMPIPVQLEPAPKLKRRTERLRLEDAPEAEIERKPRKERRPWQGVALFDKRGFRPVRLLLTMASACVIFGSFDAMKSRRWIWQKPPAEVADTLETLSPTELAPVPAGSESSPVPLPELPGIDRVIK